MRWRAVFAAVLLALAAGCGQNSRESDEGAPEVPPAPVAREVKVFFLREAPCEVHPVGRTVTAALPVEFARAALESLVAGPTEEEAAAGFRSRLPDPEQVWRYWQSRVGFGQAPPYEGEELRILDVSELPGGILRVNFSPELAAYGSGEDRVCEVIRQVEATVQQFPEYGNVSIAVDGRHENIWRP